MQIQGKCLHLLFQLLQAAVAADQLNQNLFLQKRQAFLIELFQTGATTALLKFLLQFVMQLVLKRIHFLKVNGL